MSIFEYDEEKHMRTVRSEGFEDGLEQGITQGAQEEQKFIICNMLRQNLTPELISQCTEQPVDYINEIKRNLHSEICEKNQSR